MAACLLPPPPGGASQARPLPSHQPPPLDGLLTLPSGSGLQVWEICADPVGGSLKAGLDNLVHPPLIPPLVLQSPFPFSQCGTRWALQLALWPPHRSLCPPHLSRARPDSSLWVRALILKPLLPVSLTLTSLPNNTCTHSLAIQSSSFNFFLILFQFWQIESLLLQFS